jgi:hypothetical protein
LPTSRDNDVYFPVYELDGECREASEVSFRVSILDQDIASLCIAEFAESLPEFLYPVCAGRSRNRDQKSDPRDFPLLRLHKMAKPKEQST